MTIVNYVWRWPISGGFRQCDHDSNVAREPFSERYSMNELSDSAIVAHLDEVREASLVRRRAARRVLSGKFEVEVESVEIAFPQESDGRLDELRSTVGRRHHQRHIRHSKGRASDGKKGFQCRVGRFKVIDPCIPRM